MDYNKSKGNTNDKRIEIEWNFADELVKYVEQVQKICS